MLLGETRNHNKRNEGRFFCGANSNLFTIHITPEALFAH